MIYRFNHDAHNLSWEADERSIKRNGNICSLSNENDDLTEKDDMLRKYRLKRKVSPRPAVVRTTWCKFSDSREEQQLGSTHYYTNKNYDTDIEHPWFQNIISQQQTLIAEHSVEWDRINEAIGGDKSNLMSNDIVQTSDKDIYEEDIGPYHDIYEHQHANMNHGNDSLEDTMHDLKSTKIVRKKSKRKRVFQKFWCATDEDEGDVQELPRPDAYRLNSRKGSVSSQKQSFKKNLGSSFKRKLLGNTTEDETFIAYNDHHMYQEDTDARGGIRRRPKIWDYLDKADLDPKKEAKMYAPKRPPPILDFFMVVTSFLVASVLAYYSAT